MQQVIPPRLEARVERLPRRPPSPRTNLTLSLRRRIPLNNVALTYTSGEQVEVYRFGIPATILIPLTAVFLQAWVPVRLPFFSIFDLPLLITISFAMARRSQVAGIFTGALIGLFQDALTGQHIGLYGISKTVVGFGASSLGIKLDVENAGARLLLTLVFYVVHEVVYFTIARGLVGLHLEWSWQHELGSAVANAILGVFLYALLDRLKQRT
jgi:rod shape-determining protein MreD